MKSLWVCCFIGKMDTVVPISRILLWSTLDNVCGNIRFWFYHFWSSLILVSLLGVILLISLLTYPFSCFLWSFIFICHFKVQTDPTVNEGLSALDNTRQCCFTEWTVSLCWILWKCSARAFVLWYKGWGVCFNQKEVVFNMNNILVSVVIGTHFLVIIYSLSVLACFSVYVSED